MNLNHVFIQWKQKQLYTVDSVFFFFLWNYVDDKLKDDVYVENYNIRSCFTSCYAICQSINSVPLV